MPWRETPAELERARAERPVVMPGPRGHLVGIYTPPAPGIPADLCVIWFTIPRSHRNRMWVQGARQLATRGFASFRFDYHGVGDSGGESARVDPSHPYRDDALAVIRHLRETFGHRRFVLFGSCFDARTALSAFDGEADAIEGIVFMAAPVMDLEDLVRASADRKGWAHVLGALRRPSNWLTLVDPERWRYMGTVLERIARRSVARANGDAEAVAARVPLSHTFLEHFEALTRSRARALFLYGREDLEYVSFQEAERTLWPALPAETRARLALEIWDGKVHDGTLDMPVQRRIVERVIDWIGAMHPQPAGASDA
jgi:alpha/beta superfamily hydrolase